MFNVLQLLQKAKRNILFTEIRKCEVRLTQHKKKLKGRKRTKMTTKAAVAATTTTTMKIVMVVEVLATMMTMKLILADSFNSLQNFFFKCLRVKMMIQQPTMRSQLWLSEHFKRSDRSCAKLQNNECLNSIPSVFVVLPPIQKEVLNVDHLHLSTFL